MSRLKLAKILLLTSTLLSNLGLTAPIPEREMGCGLYDAQGTLMRNKSGHFVLVMNRGAHSQREFIVVGGSAIGKMGRVRQRTHVELYVPNVIGGNTVPVVFLRKLLPASFPSKNDFMTKTTSAECRQKSFLNPG